MAQLLRSIATDGSVMAAVMDATDMVTRLQEIHKTSPVATIALGRLAIAASLMGVQLKGEQHNLTLRVDGKGPLGAMIAVSDFEGNVKAYLQNNQVELPKNRHGKFDVGAAVGSAGTLSVIKDVGDKQPYVGQTALVSGEIAADVTSYFATSEQIPTVCALGVLLDPKPPYGVLFAGGYLAQLLPFVPTSTMTQLEQNLAELAPITTLLQERKTPESIAQLLLAGLEPQSLDASTPSYRCDCSRQRVERVLISLGRKELLSMRQEPNPTEVKCHFCDKTYVFDGTALEMLSQC